MSVQNGIEFLVRTARADGGWDERLATGTGFPGVFYLTYHVYRNAFPLLALAEYRKAHQKADAGPTRMARAAAASGNAAREGREAMQ